MSEISAFGQQMVALLRDAVQPGARGLKILKEFGLVYRGADGRLIAVDDPRMDPIWAECGRLGIPVAIHVADPPPSSRRSTPGTNGSTPG